MRGAERLAARQAASRALIGFVWAWVAVGAAAQEAPQPAGEAPGTSAPEAPQAPVAAPETTGESQPTRPGRYRIGPLYLTPRLRVNTIGFDTNVLYTPTDRQADFMAMGGPALDAVLPVRGALRLKGSGGLTYLYFVRTPSQRRLMGSGQGALEWEGQRTGLILSEDYQQVKERPSFEIDRRVLFSTERQSAEIRRRLFGRVTLRVSGERMRQRVEEGEIHLGVDLRQTLSQDRQALKGDLSFGLTAKTALAFTGEASQYRLPFDNRRDADAERAMGGLRADATALISGEAMVGVVRFRPRDRSLPSTRALVANVHATLNFSAKTHLGGDYVRDLGYSGLAAVGQPFGLETETYGVRLDKDLLAGFNLELYARRSRLAGQGRMVVILPDGRSLEGLRHDTADEVGGDLGYRFRSRLRIGVAASYVTRRSTISYFGIDGLVAGLTVRYTP